jgi:hypothetical protein
MSTKFTLVYDDIRNKVKALWPTKVEVNNPYIIEDEADIRLKDSFGIAIGAGSNTNRVICGSSSTTRSFNIAIVKKHSSPSEEISARVIAEKALLNDLFDLQKYFDSNPSSDNIINIRYVNDNGIEFLNGDRFGYLMLRSTFEAEYSENL